MKRVSILVPESAVLAAIDDPRHVFSRVNDFLAAAGKPPAFDIEFVGNKREVRLHNSAYSVHVDHLLEEDRETDLVFVPAFQGPAAAFVERNRGFADWIRERHKNGAEVVSLCVGAFLLASTGLLDGRKASTHWIAADEFRRMFPEVDLVTDRIITDENGIYTSGGATSYFNLLIYLVEKFTNREMAVRTAKIFAIDLERHSQSHFVIFNGQTGHYDGDIRRVQRFIEENFERRLTVDDLSREFAISRRSLERRFRSATGNSVSEYVQRVKIEAAKKIFELSRRNVTDAMSDVGYSDTKAFRGTFKKFTGMTPHEYRMRYHRGM